MRNASCVRTGAAIVSFAIATLLIHVACNPPRFANPLTSLQSAKADPRLIGVWTDDEKRGTLTIVPNGTAGLDLVLVWDQGSGKGAGVMGFNAFPSILGGKTYLNMRGKRWIGRLGSDRTEVDNDWFFVRYEIGNDGLALWTMDEQEVKAAIKSGALKGTVDGDSSADIHVTSDAGTVANFVKNANSAKLFKTKITTFRKQR